MNTPTITRRRRNLLLLLTAAIAVLLVAFNLDLGTIAASDHDDGENDQKARSLNLTDLYVFREVDQNPSASADDLVLIMNTNPRSLARQQYYFSNNARYEFHISRVLGNDEVATGLSEGIVRFEFGPADANGEQTMTITVIRDGDTEVLTSTTSGGMIRTTTLNSEPVINELAIPGTFGSTPMTVFAGLREDPFFFDVEQYFRVRAGAAGIGPAVGFRNPGVDFTIGYNVNAIVVRIPRNFLRSPTATYDIWETVSVKGADGNYSQIERLARPAINEGLILTHAFNNALNSVGPDFEAAALAGRQPQADIAGPIVAEAKATLMAVGNSEERADALIRAFLPDVMRIDTSKPSGYGAELNALGSPIRGRLVTDDVIDITLSVLTDGAITSDNVAFAGPDATGRGHQPLLAQFPYLANPN